MNPHPQLDPHPYPHQDFFLDPHPHFFDADPQHSFFNDKVNLIYIGYNIYRQMGLVRSDPPWETIPETAFVSQARRAVLPSTVDCHIVAV
jgi:hypothetical protein